MKRIILIIMLVVFGFLTGSPFPLENPEIEAHGFGTPGTYRADSAGEIIEEDILVLCLEEVQEPITDPGIDQFFYSINAAEPFEAKKAGNTDVEYELTRIRTKIKCVEKILKKAVIETYFENGQVEGLQLNGLDRISEAKSLRLKSGDIILAVNGQTLSSKKEAYDIFKKARKRPNMAVELLRNGKAKRFLFDFRGAV
jgi:hypothetical protein